MTRDNSHELDMVVIYESAATRGQMEASLILSLLDASGIHAVESSVPHPVLGYTVSVPRNQVEQAREILDDALAAGKAESETQA